MPLIDGVIELQPWICRLPGGVDDFIPQIFRFNNLRYFFISAINQLPITIIFQKLEEFMGDTKRVVGVLTGDSGVSFRGPVGIVDLKLHALVALLDELKAAVHVVHRHTIGIRCLNSLSETEIGFRIVICYGRCKDH